MAILIINGPNLNLLGKREKNIYGSQSFDEYFSGLKQKFGHIDLSYFQSNAESGIIDKIHEVGFTSDGIIINAGAFTHTSVAIRDAIVSVSSPVVEVHISNVYAREEFRQHSYLSAVCKGVIAGFGLDSYRLALEHLLNGA
jgi:3-dehydroquinate dehydratase-2